MRRTRTDYAINRFYSPDTGRFTSNDPLTELDRRDRLQQPQGLNLYPYVLGNPTRYTDPDGLEWLYGSNGKFHWRDLPSSPLPDDTKDGVSYRAVEDGEIFTLDDKRTVYLANVWSSDFSSAFASIALPQPSEYDFLLPNKKTGELERFEGVPDHARFVEWTHYRNGEFYGQFDFMQFGWREDFLTRGEVSSAWRMGPLLSSRIAVAIPRWAKYGAFTSLVAGVLSLPSAFESSLASVEHFETKTTQTLRAARQDNPGSFGTGVVAGTLATALISPGAAEGGLISVLPSDAASAGAASDIATLSGATAETINDAAVARASNAGDGSSLMRVGRWMSQSEHEAMEATGRVQESNLNGVTSVTAPPNAAAWARQTLGTRFIEFDVSSPAVRGLDGVTGKIYGPNSVFGPRLGITEMPRAFNILHTASKWPR